MTDEDFSVVPLQEVAPSYLYFQYSDDDDLQAFVAAYNQLVQGYIDWFNQTPLGLYTAASISGSLLDWLATGIYGITRPVIVTQPSTASSSGGYNANPYNDFPYNGFLFASTGATSQIANDDIYKRVLTWVLYQGDGHQISIPWMKKRVARFIYGANGSDVSIDQIEFVSINYLTGQTLKLVATGEINGAPANTMAVNGTKLKQVSIPPAPIQKASSMNTLPTDTAAMNENQPITISGTSSAANKNQLFIYLNYSPIALTFQRLVNEGILPMPFQVTVTVTLT